jgi:hypothetical protein
MDLRLKYKVFPFFETKIQSAIFEIFKKNGFYGARSPFEVYVSALVKRHKNAQL